MRFFLIYKFQRILLYIVSMKSHDFPRFMSVFLPDRTVNLEEITGSRPSLALRRDVTLAAARSLLVEKGDISLPQIQEIRINHAPSGQPFLAIMVQEDGCPRLFPSLSVSHSGFWVSCLIGEGTAEVGLDIEDMGQEGRLSSRSYSDLADYAFSSTEIEFVRQYQEIGFYRIWTAKEAIAKCYGQGLDFALQLDLGEQLMAFFSAVNITAKEVTFSFHVSFENEFEGGVDTCLLTQIIIDDRLMATMAQRNK